MNEILFVAHTCSLKRKDYSKRSKVISDQEEMKQMRTVDVMNRQRSPAGMRINPIATVAVRLFPVIPNTCVMNHVARVCTLQR